MKYVLETQIFFMLSIFETSATCV